ncbi:hypothetical protein FSZ31_00965 [Sphingorhabdus soli]|uniref:Uncharacterized protein n=1 Tax=Flavisphingopyxis soli TaxID=2601267 RepID=A0A5C6UMN7_9SPHN|nr:hypothetical protein [Sphingorhabdus soli]TXC73366.1 hypothetical protein FSZ31_00965 [Sphingorhabdus soli]
MDFDDGVNVIFGASNTGKSFTAKLLNFMFGGQSPLPEIEERRGYDAVLMGLTLPQRGDCTLYRAASGGAFQLFDGLHSAKPSDDLGVRIQPTYDVRNSSNISTLLLEEIGLDGKKVVRNEDGAHLSFTIRVLAPYLFADEEAIIAELSPFLTGDRNLATAEKNGLRLMLTGQDDRAVVPVQPQKVRKAQQEGKYDLVEEMIAEIDESLGEIPSNRENLDDQLGKLETRLSEFQTQIRQRQENLDKMTSARRETSGAILQSRDQGKEVGLTIERFLQLDRVYLSDLDRLEAVDEGGSILLARVGRPCPLCGSEIDADSHSHGQDEIELARTAALAEQKKIRNERGQLLETMAELKEEQSFLDREIEHLRQKFLAIEHEIVAQLPKEARIREEYEELTCVRDDVVEKLRLYKQRDRLAVRLSEFSEKVPRGRGDDKLRTGIDGPTGHAFAQKVQEVLEAWNFPNSPIVSFDSERQDIQINGKARSANGKGVRAILHTASKLALLLFCQEKGLPHPGLLVLDTPLLTYREPMHNPKYGELDDDEKLLKATTLQESFYRHLISLNGKAQIIILENADPPEAEAANMNRVVFTGEEGRGRFGFFPMQSNLLN